MLDTKNSQGPALATGKRTHMQVGVIVELFRSPRRPRARVELLTTFRSLSTRDTVAVETPAFLATASRFMDSNRFCCIVFLYELHCSDLKTVAQVVAG